MHWGKGGKASEMDRKRLQYTRFNRRGEQETVNIIHRALLIIFIALLQIYRKRKRVIKDFDLSTTVSCSESDLSCRFGNVMNEPIGSGDDLVKIWQLIVFKSNIRFKFFL
jgi:hypothetical protein